MTRLYMFSYWSLFLSNRLRVNLCLKKCTIVWSSWSWWGQINIQVERLLNLGESLCEILTEISIKKENSEISHIRNLFWTDMHVYTEELGKKKSIFILVLWWQTDLTENRGRIRTFESQRQNYLLNSFKRKAWMQVSLWFSTRDHFLRSCVWVIFEIDL